jgi:uncharacterized membrane protein YphA (DoxX/SURF4 family)
MNFMKETVAMLSATTGLGRRQVLGLLQAGIGALFSASGLMKVINQDQFDAAIAGYGITSGLGSDALSLTVPLVEISLGLMLAFGVRVRFASWALAALLVVFSAAGAAVLIRGGQADCGCFPIPGRAEPIGGFFFIRNAALLLSCLSLITFGKR